MDYSYSCTSQEGHSQRRARRKRMIESGRGKKKNSNTYCHTRWTLCPLLEAGTILSVNRSRHQQPCSFSFSVSFSRLQETPQLRHTQRQRVADPRNETKRTKLPTPLPLKFFFPPFSPQRVRRVYIDIHRGLTERLAN